jgi:hypothetical protein
MREVDITPTPEGQRNILRLFVDQIQADIVKPRREPDLDILGSIIDLAFTAGFNAPRDVEQATALREELVAYAKE